MAERAKTGRDAYDATAIRVLGGIEHVRLRPAMYIGDTSERGVHHLFEEVVANSIDEAMAGECDEIHVRLYADGSLSVADNGRGIPVDIHEQTGKPALEVVMTTLNAGGKFDHSSYKVSAGLHGVGVSCVNALSEWMEVEVRRDGRLYYQRYERGEPRTPVETRGRSSRRGTRVTFKPDPQIFGEATFDREKIAHRLRELAFLNGGVRITLSLEGGPEEVFHYQNGISEFVSFLNREKRPVHEDVIHIAGEVNGTHCEIAFQYNDGYNEIVLSFANNINTVDGGAHLSGFRSALTRTFNAYGRARGLLKNHVPTGDDYKEGLTAVVSVKLPSPQFEGQTKTRLGNRDVQSVVEQIADEQLAVYCEEHPRVAQAIVEKALEAARAREAARKARELTRRKGALAGGGLPAKLRDCARREREGTELFIVEGQSAGGTASMGRDREFQAILPLRGVILNVEKARVDKMLANEEIATLISALGTGIGAEEFDLERLRYSKIIIMTDADIDGAHIRTLLLTFFFRQMPQLITHGHLYIAQPPLYRITQRGRRRYVHDDRELQQVLVELGAGRATLEYALDGEARTGELPNEELRRLVECLHALERFARRIEQQGMSLEEYLALRGGPSGREFPLYRVTHTDSEGREHVRHFYREEEYDRFVSALQEELKRTRGEELEIVEGDEPEAPERAGGPRNVLRPHKFHDAPELSRIIAEIEDRGLPSSCLLPPAEGAPGGRFVLRSDGVAREVSCLSEVIPALREMGRRGIEVERYKGLGEMNAAELAETTLRPETRTIVQVTIGDAVEADKHFSILAGKDVRRRREFIEQHALEVRNLDV